MIMCAFISVLIKDLRIRFSSPLELVFFLVLPLVFTVVLSGTGGAGGAAGGDAAAARVVLVQDAVQSAVSRGVIARLGADPGLSVRETRDPVELLNDAGADLLLTFTPSAASSLREPFDVKVRLSPWRGSAESTARRVAALLNGGTPSPAAPDVSPGASDSSDAATGSAGQVVTWVLVPLLGLGANFIAERKRGTMRRVLASPARRSAVTAGIAGAEMLAALVQVALLVLFGAFAFHLPWLAHPLELAALSAAFCAAGAALGAFLGTFCSTQRQAGSLGLAVAMVLAVLGGCWYPASLFPAALREAAHWNPAGWAMEGFLSVLSPGSAAAAALRDAGLLSLFAAAAFLLTAVVSRARRAPDA
jgi:ABC-2 type transport system permease protein